MRRPPRPPKPPTTQPRITQPISHTAEKNGTLHTAEKLYCMGTGEGRNRYFELISQLGERGIETGLSLECIDNRALLRLNILLGRT